MSEVEISYKGSTIATMNASGTKTLETEGTWLEDNIEILYTRPSSGGNNELVKLIDRTITSISNSEISYIGRYAFAYCSFLTTVSFPACTNISNYAFAYCYDLTTASFPVCTSIGSSAFYGCSNLTTASFPSCTSIGNAAFQFCYNLTTVSFPACTNISTMVFSGCSKLTTVSFPACIKIGSSAFQRCYNLTSLYLTGSSVTILSASDAFTSTPIGGYTTSTIGIYGSIFVPSSLYNTYKSATNWAYFSSRFVSV